jgi:ABC-type proline/glycine betaine transport system ATPase subunit
MLAAIKLKGEKTMFDDKDIKRAKVDIRAELNRLDAQQNAKEVAGKSIGRYGLFYITLIVVIGVLASLELAEGKMAAVMGLLGASLTALISMLNNIAGATPKQERPEFEVMKQLIDRLDRMADRDPMSVTVDGDKVTVKKGDNTMESVK